MAYGYHDILNVFLTLLLIGTVLLPILRAFVPTQAPHTTTENALTPSGGAGMPYLT